MADYTEIKAGFVKSKIGLVGAGILLCLILVSALTAVFVPVDTYKQWNNPASWTAFPKSALPSWVNFFSEKKMPEHQIINTPQTILQEGSSVFVTVQKFETDYNYDYFPNDFLLQYTAEYEGSPLLQVNVLRPDGTDLQLVSSSLPHSSHFAAYSDKIFSTNDSIKKNLVLQSSKFSYPVDGMTAKEIIFSKSAKGDVLKGKYVFFVRLASVDSKNGFSDSRFVLGGKVFGLVGTDELRRDLSIGLLWGTPVALFIGVVVAVHEQARAGARLHLSLRALRAGLQVRLVLAPFARRQRAQHVGGVPGGVLITLGGRIRSGHRVTPISCRLRRNARTA